MVRASKILSATHCHIHLHQTANLPDFIATEKDDLLSEVSSIPNDSGILQFHIAYNSYQLTLNLKSFTVTKVSYPSPPPRKKKTNNKPTLKHKLEERPRIVFLRKSSCSPVEHSEM